MILRTRYGKCSVNKWKSPIYSLILGTKTYIVLSSPTTVKDILDKKSAIFSSRPDMFLGQEVVSDNQRFVTMESTQRAAAESYFSAQT
jgi:hypothetical protein